jgi:hypothetical protein
MDHSWQWNRYSWCEGSTAAKIRTPRSQVLSTMTMSVLLLWVGISPEDGAITALRNIGIYLQVHTALQSRISNHGGVAITFVVK